MSIKTAWTDIKETNERLQALSNLVGLLGALPRDSLTCFESVSFTLDRNLLGLLLQTQSQIKNIVVFVTGEDDDGRLLDPLHVRKSLGTLESL